MPRRDAFSMLRGASVSTSEQGVTPPITSKSSEPPAIKPLDFIPTAEPRKKRERKWEKEHRGQVVTYRGIPIEMRQTIIHLAESLGVAVDEIARAFLEYSLAHHQTGELPIHPYPKAQRMTLYPDGETVLDKKSNAWLQDAFSAHRSGKKSKKGSQPKRWESCVSYRLPVSLKQEVKEIAEMHIVGIGELVFFLFQYALGAFENGQLRLDAYPKVTGHTLFKTG